MYLCTCRERKRKRQSMRARHTPAAWRPPAKSWLSRPDPSQCVHVATLRTSHVGRKYAYTRARAMSGALLVLFVARERERAREAHTNVCTHVYIYICICRERASERGAAVICKVLRVQREREMRCKCLKYVRERVGKRNLYCKCLKYVRERERESERGTHQCSYTCIYIAGACDTAPNESRAHTGSSRVMWAGPGQVVIRQVRQVG